MSISAHMFVAIGHKSKKPALRYFYSHKGMVIVGRPTKDRPSKLAVTLHTYSDAQVLQRLASTRWQVSSTVIDPDNVLSDSIKSIIPDTVELASDKEAEKYLASRAAKSSLAEELSAAQDADFYSRYGFHRPGSAAAAEAPAAAPAAGASAPAAPEPKPKPKHFTVASAVYPKGTQLTLAEVQQLANAGVDADVLNEDGSWTNIKLSGILKEAGLVVRSASRFEKPVAAPLDALMEEIAALKAALAAQAAEQA